MVTNERLQRKIAELLGWKHIIISELHPDEMIATGRDGTTYTVPNWPTDRNASYELPVRGFTKYSRALKTAAKYYKFQLSDKPLTAEQECLIWLLYKGYRWVDCDSCEGEPHGVSEDCTDCSGDGGKWVHDG